MRPRTFTNSNSSWSRLRIEQLEDRSVPTTFTWIGADNGNWNVGTNWDQGAAPTTGADVVINNGSNVVYNTTVEINTLSVAANSKLTEDNGTLTIDSDSTLAGDFTFNFGTLNGSGDVTINGLLTWHDGTMSGAGAIIANGGIALFVTGFPTLQGSRRLDNNGTATWTGGGSIIFSGGGTFNNNGTFDVETDEPMGGNGGGSPVFNNAGTFRKSAGTGLTNLTVSFNNTGVVDLLTGTTSFSGFGLNPAATGAGSWTVAAGATLEFGGSTSTLDAGSTVSGAGTMHVSQGTVNLDGAYSVSNTVLKGGHTLFNAPANTTTLTMGVGNAAPTLEGSGDVTVSGLLTWDGGSMMGTGTTFANGGMALNVEQNNALAIIDRRVDNNGTATWTGAGFIFFGGAFNNNGTFDAKSDQTISSSGTPVFNNAGTFKKSAGAGTATVSVPFNNTGVVDARTGTLNFNGTLANLSSGTLTGGWIVRDNATLNLPAAITTNRADVTLDGANSTFPNINGLVANDAAGNLTIQNGRTFTSAAGFANAGNVTIGTGSTLATATGDYTQTGGLTSVLGTLDPAESANIQGGTLDGSGTILGDTINAGIVSRSTSSGILTIAGNYTQTASGALNLEIGGVTAGTLFGQLAVAGNLDLDGALNVTLVNDFAPLSGDSLRIVDRTGAGTVNGSFAGLAENAILSLGKFRLHVTYAGGTGDDTVLTAINIAPTIDVISDPDAIPMNSGQQTIDLAGIAAGGVDTQTLTITALSSNPGLIPNPTVVYSSPNATGSLSYTPAANQTGTAVITVTVTDNGGTANGGSDTTTRTFTVVVAAPVATATTIASANPTPSAFGDDVTFTATVAPSAGNLLPTGTLVFKDGDTVLGTSTSLVAANGVATATFVTTATQLGIGDHAITAVFAGNDLFIGSTSSALTQTVTQAQTTTTFTNDTPTTSVRGAAVTLTVTVSGLAGVLPSGTVTFHDGATILGESNLTIANGVATATFVVPAGQLVLGGHSFTASFGGDSTFAASTSTVFTHTVGPLTALADTYFARRNRALKIPVVTGLLANDLNAGGHVKIVAKPAVGWLFAKPDGSFSYIPPPGFLGKVTFKYRIVNSFGVSVPVVVTIKVKPGSFFP